jgi:hypothetical protein
MFCFKDKCQRIQRLLSERLDAPLSARAEQKVLKHLAECDECREAMAFFEELKQTASALDTVPPPTYLWERVSVQLDEDPWGEDELSHPSVREKRALFGSLKDAIDMTGAVVGFALIAVLCLLPGSASENSMATYSDTVRAEEYSPDVEYLSLYMMTNQERFPKEVRDYYLNLLDGLNQTIKKIKSTLDRFPQNRHIQSQLTMVYEKKIELYRQMGYPQAGGGGKMMLKQFRPDFSRGGPYE